MKDYGRSITRGLFLLDAVGALLSAILLGIVLPHFQPVTGMPVTVLKFLACFPVGFVVYDLLSYFLCRQRWRACLKGIALANAAYCVVSLLTALRHFQELTALGMGYFAGEICLVLLLAGWEYRVAHR